MGKGKIRITVDADVSGLREALKLAQELEDTLKKANSLLDELASKELTVEINV